MAVTDQIAPMVNRLFDDDHVREQLGTALVRSRRAYRRAKGEKASEALQDKRLMEHVTGAARSLQEAVRAIAGSPPPEPPRRGRRTVKYLLAAAAVGAAAVYFDSRAGRTAPA